MNAVASYTGAERIRFVYRVTRATEPTNRPWRLEGAPEGMPTQILGTYKTKKSAVTAGRLMAGWRHTLEVYRG